MCWLSISLVVQGCIQKYATDYDETFGPVGITSSIDSIICAVWSEVDVTTAFLNGNLKEEVYTQMPKCSPWYSPQRNGIYSQQVTPAYTCKYIMDAGEKMYYTLESM